MKPEYRLRPLADEDLVEHAFYLASNANRELGDRFLVAAHETFARLATQPRMGWRFRSKRRELKNLRVFRILGFERTLVLYFPHSWGVEIVRVIHGSGDLPRVLK